MTNLYQRKNKFKKYRIFLLHFLTKQDKINIPPERTQYFSLFLRKSEKKS